MIQQVIANIQHSDKLCFYYSFYCMVTIWHFLGVGNKQQIGMYI